MDVAGSRPVVRPSETIAAVILAGGRASRMGGGDKTLLPFGGRPLLEHVLERLQPAHRHIALSANGDPARFAAFGVPVVGDGAFAGSGPLGGVLAGLRWAAGVGAASLLVVPGDAPRLPWGVAARLLPGPSYAVAERAHPLVAVLPAAAAGALEAWLVGGERRAALAFLEGVGARAVRFLHEAEFLNVNTPEELGR